MTIQFKCQQCGASLYYEPGTEHLKCTACGSENSINIQSTQIIEEDYNKALQLLDEQEKQVPSEEKIHLTLLKCQGCGAETTIKEIQTSSKCSFCGTPSILSAKIEKNLIKPKYLLPFAIDHKQAQLNLKKWIQSLWFAPTALKELVKFDGLNGIYIPYWTYDSFTHTHYTGQRGVYYYETESYTVNGQRRTRQVRRTRWYPASGYVDFQFDDILIPGSHSVPKEKTLELEPWDLNNLVEFKSEFLSGFQAESYQVHLRDGFTDATQIIQSRITELIKRDIGGDTQRIHNRDTEYSKITYKHLLLPIWISAFKYNKTVFRVLVNARTGEVQGERPWSWWKIGFSILSATISVLTISALYEYSAYKEHYYGLRGLTDLLYFIFRSIQ